MPNATADVIVDVLKGKGPLHSGRAPIFRIDGDATDRRFTTDDMNTVVKNYNEGMGVTPKPTARWKLGHETDGSVLEAVLANRSDMPGLGEFDSLSFDGKTLFGEFKNMPHAVREAIKRGTYGSWSAEIYRDYAGHGATLDAVGLLGARQPGKKALGAIVYNSAAGLEMVRCAPVVGPILFLDHRPEDKNTGHLDGDNNMPLQSELGAVIMAAVQAKAAGAEDMTTDTVLGEMASTAGIDTAMLVAMISGQADVMPDDQQLMAFAQVLGIDMGILQEARDGGSEVPTVTEPDETLEDEEELVTMAEKKKKADAAAKAAKAAKTTPPVQPTPEQFAELTAEKDAALAKAKSFEDTLKAQGDILKQHSVELSASRIAKAKQDVEYFCETELNATGRVTGTNLVKTVAVLKALPDGLGEQIIKFAEGVDPRSAVKALLLDLLPAKTRKAGSVAARATDDQRLKGAVEAFAELKRTGSESVWKDWAHYGAQLSTEEITKGAEMLPEDCK